LQRTIHFSKLPLHPHIDVVKGGATLVVTRPIEDWSGVLGDVILTEGVHAWDIVIGSGSDDVAVGIRVGIPPPTAEGYDAVSVLCPLLLC
jgi:hypothetical protein